MPREQHPVDRKALDDLCKALSEAKHDDIASRLHKQGSGPLVEDISGNPNRKKVTFLYYDEKNEFETVKLQGQIGFLPNVLGEMPPYPPIGPATPMQKIEGTKNVWALTVELPAKLCTEYSFGLKRKDESKLEQHSDPLSSQFFSSFSEDPHPISVFDLSPPQPIIGQKAPRIERYSIDEKGTITPIDSKYDPAKHEHERIFSVHFPQGYDEKKPYPMRLFLDGRWYKDSLNVPAMFDNEPTVNIMLEPKPIGTAKETQAYLDARTQKNCKLEDPAAKDRDKEYIYPRIIKRT